MNCKQCQKSFTVPARSGRRPMFCSRECRHTYNVPYMRAYMRAYRYEQKKVGYVAYLKRLIANGETYLREINKGNFGCMGRLPRERWHI